MATRTKARALLYGQASQCDVRAGDLAGRGLEGISFRLTYSGESVAGETPLPGLHHVYPALAAAAVALTEGLTLAEIAAALQQARPELRLRPRQAASGAPILA